MSRGDAARLEEWVTYHQAIGFDEIHIVLDNPCDDSANILRSLDGSIIVDERSAQGDYFDNMDPNRYASVVQWRGEHAAELEDWAFPIIDPQSYRQFIHLPAVLNKYAAQKDCWVAVIDVDEFIVVPGRTIQDITSAAEAPRVRFLNLNFDTSMWTPGEPVLETCVNRWAREDIVALDNWWQHRAKAIARHDSLFPFVSQHPISHGPVQVLDTSVGRLHHYKRPLQGSMPPYRVVDSAAADVLR